MLFLERYWRAAITLYLMSSSSIFKLNGVQCQINFDFMLRNGTTPITIGTFFEKDIEESVKDIFNLLIQRQCNDERIQSFLQTVVNINYIHTADVFKLYKLICAQYEGGMYATLAAVTPESFETFHSLANTFKVPLLTPWFSEKIWKSSRSDDYAISLTPDYHKAVSDTIDFYGWKNIIYLYDSVEGLLRLQELYNDKNLKFKITNVRQITNASDTISYLRSIEAENRWSSKYVVVDCKSQLAKDILIQHVHDLYLGRRNYHYFFTGLIMDEKWEDRPEFAAVNVTGFRIIDQDNPLVKTIQKLIAKENKNYTLSAQSALLYDSLKVIIEAYMIFVINKPKALWNMIQGVKDRNENKMMDCGLSDSKGNKFFKYGEELLNIIKKTDIEGLSGRITFNEKGHRINFTMQIVEIKFDSSVETVARWSDIDGLTPTVKKMIIASNFKRNKTYIVSSMLRPRLLMRSFNNGKETYFGFYKDLLDLMSDKLDMKYEIHIVRDGKIGGPNPDVVGKWDGMIGELMHKKADMAICPLEDPYEKERYVDFSKPFIPTDLIPAKKFDDIKYYDTYIFLMPFSNELTIAVGFSIMAITCTLYLIAHISPAEWRLKLINSPENDGTQRTIIVNPFTFGRCLWIVFSSLVHQCSGHMPRSRGVRIVIIVWRVYSLVLIAIYTASLTSVIAIRSLYDSKVFTSTDIYDYTYGKEMQESLLSTPTFALEHDYTVNRSWMNFFYFTNYEQTCKEVVTLLAEEMKEYALAFPKDSGLRAGINECLTSLKDSGELNTLIKKWFSVTNCERKISHPELVFGHMSMLFYILLICLLGAVIISVIDYFIRKIKQNNNQPQEESALELEVENERPLSRALSPENELVEVPDEWPNVPCAECYVPVNLENNVFPPPPAAFNQP